MRTKSPVESGRVAEQMKKLDTIDFTNVKRKLMEPTPEGKGWDQACCEAAELWYRRFLSLCIMFPGTKIVPNAMIDAFWHQHILDTKAYAADCHAVFGGFVHHNPYYGMNGDAAERDASFTETNRLYLQEFGEDPRALGADALECSSDCGWVEKVDSQAQLVTA